MLHWTEPNHKQASICKYTIQMMLYVVEGEQGPVQSRFHWATSGGFLRRWHSSSVRPELKQVWIPGGRSYTGTWLCMRWRAQSTFCKRGCNLKCKGDHLTARALDSRGIETLLFSSSLFGCLGAAFSPSILLQTDAKIQSYRRAKEQIKVSAEGLQGELSAVKENSGGWWCEPVGGVSGCHAQSSGFESQYWIDWERWHRHAVLEL